MVINPKIVWNVDMLGWGNLIAHISVDSFCTWVWNGYFSILCDIYKIDNYSNIAVTSISSNTRILPNRLNRMVFILYFL